MAESPKGELSVTVAAEGANIVLVFAGELDLASAPLALEIVDHVFADRPRRVVLDLAALRFMDTKGVDVLNQCANLGRRHHVAVEHRGAHGVVALLLSMPGIDVSGAGARRRRVPLG